MPVIEVIPDIAFPEWRQVLQDGHEIGQFGREEELGVIRWVAFNAKNCRIGSFGGRGAANKARRAVIKGTTEVDRLSS